MLEGLLSLYRQNYFIEFIGTTLPNINELHYLDSKDNAMLTNRHLLMKDEIFNQNEKNMTIDIFDVNYVRILNL